MLEAGGCALCAGGGEWCAMCAMGAGGHALHAVPYSVLYAILHAALYAVPYAALYSGGRGGELRLLEVVE